MAKFVFCLVKVPLGSVPGADSGKPALTKAGPDRAAESNLRFLGPIPDIPDTCTYIGYVGSECPVLKAFLFTSGKIHSGVRLGQGK